jgi:hypothetical protein
MTVNNNFEIIGEGAEVAQFNLLSRNLREKCEENHENPQSG